MWSFSDGITYLVVVSLFISLNQWACGRLVFSCFLWIHNLHLINEPQMLVNWIYTSIEFSSLVAVLIYFLFQVHLKICLNFVTTYLAYFIFIVNAILHSGTFCINNCSCFSNLKQVKFMSASYHVEVVTKTYILILKGMIFVNCYHR
jgi:hypothetical protein